MKSTYLTILASFLLLCGGCAPVPATMTCTMPGSQNNNTFTIEGTTYTNKLYIGVIKSVRFDGLDGWHEVKIKTSNVGLECRIEPKKEME